MSWVEITAKNFESIIPTDKEVTKTITIKIKEGETESVPCSTNECTLMPFKQTTYPNLYSIFPHCLLLYTPKSMFKNPTLKIIKYPDENQNIKSIIYQFVNGKLKNETTVKLEYLQSGSGGKRTRSTKRKRRRSYKRKNERKGSII
jgi:hypothetical protein